MMQGANDPRSHLLVVDDDVRICQMLTRYFEGEGYRVTVANGASQMREALASEAIDVMLLDIVLPGEDGLTLAREVRAGSDIGILMLTGRGEVVDRIVGLEVGADDYIAKPFHLREVLARVKSVLRRRGAPVEAEAPSPKVSREVLSFDGWQLDISRRELTAPDGQIVPLTTGEFGLLETMARHPGRVFERDTLMDLTRGRSRDVFDRTIDAQIARLRKKVEIDPKRPAFIKSVRGVGYVFTGRIER
jgi:two-component system phosphate regulon response regulator OmpR